MAAEMLRDLFESKLELEQFVDEYRQSVNTGHKRNLDALSADNFIQDQLSLSTDKVFNFDNFVHLLTLVLLLAVFMQALYNYHFKFGQYNMLLNSARQEVLSRQEEDLIELQSLPSNARRVVQ